MNTFPTQKLVITITLTLGIGTLRNCLDTGNITVVYLETAEIPDKTCLSDYLMYTCYTGFVRP